MMITDGSELDAPSGIPRRLVHDAQCDGERLVVARSEEHMAALIAQFMARPFVDAELRAGKIGARCRRIRGAETGFREGAGPA